MNSSERSGSPSSSPRLAVASSAARGPSRGEGGVLTGRTLVRVICTAGSGALEYTHAFVTAYTADHLRGAVAQRLSVGAYELLSNALNFGSVSSDIVIELIESENMVGVRVANDAIAARISMLTEHLLKLKTNAEQTFLEELRRSVTGGIPRPMLGLARVSHEAGLTLDLQVQERRVAVTAQCRR
ncbi:MAG TPA: hypothetical protein VJV79_28120 [Polyangiaceae bacterium]|nr:hypothetical protein [Polyangiaceae bacterium]